MPQIYVTVRHRRRATRKRETTRFWRCNHHNCYPGRVLSYAPDFMCPFPDDRLSSPLWLEAVCQLSYSSANIWVKFLGIVVKSDSGSKGS